VSATPLVRQLAVAAGVDLTTLSGTGAGGRITKRDVQVAAAAARPAGWAAPAAANEFDHLFATPGVDDPTPMTGFDALFRTAGVDAPGDEPDRIYDQGYAPYA
jgi:pyruvate/2-oxoglutarate dehydrogenase complex dihydrolipoamide acyltransferase (E2) component